MARYNLELNIKGISNMTPRSDYSVDISLDNVDIGFINEISAEDIILNFDDEKEFLFAIDDNCIFEYLRDKGYAVDLR